MGNNLLVGKNALILGVANRWSIAWAIAQAFAREGARLAFTYQGERQEEDVRKLASALGSSLVLPCDVTVDEQIANVFKVLKDEMGSLDCLVHSLAFAKREELQGEYVNTSRDGFLLAHNVSVYSLVALCQHAKPLMLERGGSIVTLTYIGSERVVENYNVMGVAKAALEASVRYLANDLGPHNIRVNAISAGPIKTVSASGVKGFSKILEVMRERAPLRRNTDPSEVADTAVFLCSDLARGITGEIIYVDSGFHIMGL